VIGFAQKGPSAVSTDQNTRQPVANQALGAILLTTSGVLGTTTRASPNAANKESASDRRSTTGHIWGRPAAPPGAVSLAER
jgi:hypothetical protein